MSDYFKEILNELVLGFANKKNLINILILAILVLAIPLTINLVRQQQILFSKAATDSVQLVDNSCTITVSGKKVLTCPTVTLNFVAPSETDVIVERLVNKVYAQGCHGGDADGITQNQASCLINKRPDIKNVYVSGGWCDELITYPAMINDWLNLPNKSSNDVADLNSCSLTPRAGTVAAGTPGGTAVPVCPVTASCCSQPLKTCGTTSTFDGKSKDTSCPTGYQWCYSGYCINESYDGNGTTGKCTATVTTPSCPVTASCCSQPLKTCGTTASFDGVSKDTACPTGFQWCYRATSGAGGYCINEIYDGKGTTGSCTPPVFVCTKDDYGPLSNKAQWCACAAQNNDVGSLTRESCPQAPAAPTASLTVSPNPATKNATSWPDLSLQVGADFSVAWGVFYQNGSTCTKSSCTLQGWTPIGNTGTGNATVVWPSAQTTNIPAGVHTFAVINRSNTQVLATYDVSFTQGTTTPTPSPTPGSTQNIVKVRYAENSADLTNPNIRKEVAYLKGGVKQDITFVDPKVGTKFVYAQFIDDKGQVVVDDRIKPYPFQIDYIGPTPLVSGLACEVNIASSTTPNSPSSDLILTFTGTNFASQPGTITLASGGTVSIDSWTNTKVVGRLLNLQPSATVTGTSYTATLTTKDNRKGQDPQGRQDQQCLVGITQISLGAKLFCRAQRDFDQDNVELTLILDKDHTQKSTEKVVIDKDGNISNIKTKLRAGDNYIVCIKAPLSLRRCSAPFIPSSGTNNISFPDLPIGDYNGDGKINSVDASLLRSQWGTVDSSKNCDVNRDGICNSFEWSCMLHDFPASDTLIP